MATIILGGTIPRRKMRQGVPLVGTKDGVNTVFTLPGGDKARHENPGPRLKVHVNGQRIPLAEYVVSESGGPGTGYDTVTLGFALLSPDDVDADYTLK